MQFLQNRWSNRSPIVLMHACVDESCSEMFSDHWYSKQDQQEQQEFRRFFHWQDKAARLELVVPESLLCDYKIDPVSRKEQAVVRLNGGPIVHYPLLEGSVGKNILEKVATVLSRIESCFAYFDLCAEVWL
ncbi:MAG: hypothetical protein GY820_16855 [Gammaproteobacteria bacterium]|nr:hypothetical protein [Gammaproteobacteria bacterium]